MDVLSGLISIPDAAPLLGVSVRTAWQYEADSKLRSLRHNGRVYTRQEWIDEFFRKLIDDAESKKTVPHVRTRSAATLTKKSRARTASPAKKPNGKSGLYNKSRSKRGASK